MRGQRIGYVSLLVAASLYHVFHARYISWMILLLLLILPVISLCITLLFHRHCRLSISGGNGYQQADAANLPQISLHVSVPVFPVKARLQFENLFYGTQTKQKITIKSGDDRNKQVPIQDAKCGVIRCEVKRAGMLDLMGLFCLPLRVPAPEQILVLPMQGAFSEEQAEEAAAGAGEEDAAELEASNAGHEFFDIRTYRDGDTLRHIHWKLTARYEELIVREYGREAGHTAYVAVEWAGQPEAAQKTLSKLMGVVSCFEKLEQPYTVLWDTPKLGMQTASGREELLDGLVWQMLADVPPADAVKRSYLDYEDVSDNEKVLYITPETVSLWDGSTGSEVLL